MKVPTRPVSLAGQACRNLEGVAGFRWLFPAGLPVRRLPN